MENIEGSIPKVEWDFEGIHYFDNGPLTVQYLFVLDALNFCFWPGMSKILQETFRLYKTVCTVVACIKIFSGVLLIGNV